MLAGVANKVRNTANGIAEKGFSSHWQRLVKVRDQCVDILGRAELKHNLHFVKKSYIADWKYCLKNDILIATSTIAFAQSSSNPVDNTVFHKFIHKEVRVFRHITN